MLFKLRRRPVMPRSPALISVPIVPKIRQGQHQTAYTVKSEWTDCNYFVFGSASLLYIKCAGMARSL